MEMFLLNSFRLCDYQNLKNLPFKLATSVRKINKPVGLKIINIKKIVKLPFRSLRKPFKEFVNFLV